jgi:ketosteroid isomerase-like protein
MPEENAETGRGVRTLVTVAAKSRRRTLDERVFVRFPALARVFLSAWSRLPPRSRLRRAFLGRFLRQGYEAGNRRDFDFLLLGLDPEIEWHFDASRVGGFLPPDLLGVHRGHEGYLRAWEAALEAVDDFKVEPEEVIDMGDRLFIAIRQTGHGTSSGIPVEQSIFQVFTLQRGLVIRLEEFTDRDKALEAAGLGN